MYCSPEIQDNSLIHTDQDYIYTLRYKRDHKQDICLLQHLNWCYILCTHQHQNIQLMHYQLDKSDIDRYAAGNTVHILNPMLSLNYNEEEILASLDEFGWKRSSDTGSHSSNCRINDLGIKVHLEKYGFHPYEQEIAEQVRTGNLTRAKALEKITAPLDEDRIAAVEIQVRQYG